MNLSNEEVHVFMAFLKKEYPDAYTASLQHLQGYQEFMNEQAKIWLAAKYETPELILPRSVSESVTRKLSHLDLPAYETDDDSFFDSPRNIALIEKLLDTPCPVKSADFLKKDLFK